MNILKYIKIGIILLIVSGCDSHQALTFTPSGAESKWGVGILHFDGLLMNQSNLFLEITSSRVFTTDFKLLANSALLQINDGKPVNISELADVTYEEVSINKYKIAIKRFKKSSDLWGENSSSEVYVCFSFMVDGHTQSFKCLVSANN